jgi:hypothetical protein
VSSNPHSWRFVLDTALCDQVCQWLVEGWWFSSGTLDIVILFAKCLLLRLCYFYLGGGRLGLSPIHGKMKTSNIHILLHIKRTFSNTRFDQIWLKFFGRKTNYCDLLKRWPASKPHKNIDLSKNNSL